MSVRSNFIDSATVAAVVTFAIYIGFWRGGFFGCVAHEVVAGINNVEVSS